MHRWMRVSRYRYITRVGLCACKRVKRRDIFYIYGYLPLLCSRAGGLWQRANRPLLRSPTLRLTPVSTLRLSFFVSPLISARWPLSGASIEASLFVLPATIAYTRVSLPLTLWSAIQDAQPTTRPCVISHAIPYSVPTMICSRLVPR